jgi:hypothetical protein
MTLSPDGATLFMTLAASGRLVVVDGWRQAAGF